MRSSGPITVALAVVSVLILSALITAEVVSASHDHVLPQPVRLWFHWGSVVSIVAAATMFSVYRSSRVRTEVRALRAGQREIHARLDRIEAAINNSNLPAAIRDAVHEELHAALADCDLSQAIQDAVSPTLHAIRDYTGIREHLASVTPMHRSE